MSAYTLDTLHDLYAGEPTYEALVNAYGDTLTHEQASRFARKHSTTLAALAAEADLALAPEYDVAELLAALGY